jgi:hypothetical protein
VQQPPPIPPPAAVFANPVAPVLKIAAPSNAYPIGPNAGSRRRLHPALLVAVGVVLALIAVFAVTTLTHDNPQVADGGSAREPGGSSAPSTAYRTDNRPSTAEQAASDLTFDNMRSMVLMHYADLPSNPAASWTRLDSHFRSQTNWDDYVGFWSTIRSVTVDSVRPRGPDSVTARLTYVMGDGEANTEDRWLSFVSSAQGLKIHESHRI